MGEVGRAIEGGLQTSRLRRECEGYMYMYMVRAQVAGATCCRLDGRAGGVIMSHPRARLLKASKGKLIQEHEQEARSFLPCGSCDWDRPRHFLPKVELVT